MDGAASNFLVCPLVSAYNYISDTSSHTPTPFFESRNFACSTLITIHNTWTLRKPDMAIYSRWYHQPGLIAFTWPNSLLCPYLFKSWQWSVLPPKTISPGQWGLNILHPLPAVQEHKTVNRSQSMSWSEFRRSHFFLVHQTAVRWAVYLCLTYCCCCLVYQWSSQSQLFVYKRVEGRVSL